MTRGCSLKNVDVNLPFHFVVCREPGETSVTEHCRRVVLLHSILKEEKWVMRMLYNCRHVFPQISCIQQVVKCTKASFQGGGKAEGNTQLQKYTLTFNVDLAINIPNYSRFLLIVQVCHILQNISPSTYSF